MVGNSSSARAQLHHYHYWAACGNQVLSTVYFEKRQNGGLITEKALLISCDGDYRLTFEDTGVVISDIKQIDWNANKILT